MILIFDLFETLVNNISIDFNRGLRPFWERYYQDKCSFEEIKSYGEELFNHLLALHKEGKEFAFVKEELPMYAEKYGGDAVSMTVEEEADFLMLCNETELMPGIKSFLTGCREKGIPMYVLSNSGFSGYALMELLDRYEIKDFFKKIWSSADFGIIKPSRELFEKVIQRALQDNPDEKREDIFYIGDTYSSDIIGAGNAGIKPVWLNLKGEEDTDGRAAFVLKGTGELGNLFKLPGNQ